MERIALTIQMEAQQLDVLLIDNQVTGLYKASEELMKRYLSKAQELPKHFCNFTI